MVNTGRQGELSQKTLKLSKKPQWQNKASYLGTYILYVVKKKTNKWLLRKCKKKKERVREVGRKEKRKDIQMTNTIYEKMLHITCYQGTTN